MREATWVGLPIIPVPTTSMVESTPFIVSPRDSRARKLRRDRTMECFSRQGMLVLQRGEPLRKAVQSSEDQGRVRRVREVGKRILALSIDKGAMQPCPPGAF